jgi:hypothetical protein
VTSSVNLHEGKVTRGLDLAVLLLSVGESQIGDLGPVERLLARPLERLSPSLVSEPVADEVSIASIDENGNLLENAGHKAVEGLHPVALEQKVTVDVEVAALVAGNLNAKSVHDRLLVEIVADPSQSAIAKIAAVLALAANVVDVLPCALVRSDERVVTINRGGHAAPYTAAFVAVIDQRLATGQRVVHSLALALSEDGGIATLTASHGAVVLVLSIAISQAIANQNGLEVDVAVLVRQNLRGEDRDVVASIGLAGDMEVLFRIFGELVEEERQQRVDVLAGGDSVADR